MDTLNYKELTTEEERDKYIEMKIRYTPPKVLDGYKEEYSKCKEDGGKCIKCEREVFCDIARIAIEFEEYINEQKKVKNERNE